MNTGIAAWSPAQRKMLGGAGPGGRDVERRAAVGVSEDAMLVSLRSSGAVLRPEIGTPFCADW